MPDTIETQVCIVGAGAAGGIIALELAHAGVQVVILESGPKHDVSKRFEYSQRLLRWENPWKSPVPDLDRHTTSGPVGYDLEWNRARGIGGSTLHWEGYTPRFHPNDFRLQSLYGVGRDWPTSYEDLEPYYQRAEVALGVAGEADNRWAAPRSGPFPLPSFPFSYSDQFFSKACASLGITFSKLPQARNSIPYGDRAQCASCGTCHACPTGAKASTELTHIPQAEATGKVRVITNATVLRIEAEGTKKVRSLVYAGHDKAEHRLTAEVFILAAGAVENARLLLLSRSSAFPNGLANRGGVVGKCFMSHPNIDVTGWVKQKVYPFRTGFSTAISTQFAVDRDRRTEGAFFLEFLNSAGLAPDALAMQSGLTGAALRRHVQESFGYVLGIRIYCEQLPDHANSLSLNPNVRDYFGNAVPHIHYGIGEYERRALRAGEDTARKILTELGASKIRAHQLRLAAHQIGTHQMGTDPTVSVVDGNLRSHDLPNLFLIGSGCYPTATCTHPTLTIAAMAIRLADHLKTELAVPKQNSGTARA